MSVTLRLSHLSFTTLALIDSEDDLIDEDLAKQLGCTLDSLKKARRAMDLVGQSTTLITHRTHSFTLVLSGIHCEVISRALIRSPRTPIMLGYSLLLRHNLVIDWPSGQLCSWSLDCHAHCLCAAIPNTVPDKSLSTNVFSTDITGVPSEYHNLHEVFSKPTN